MRVKVSVLRAHFARAWRKFPDHPHMQTCYARRLAERGEWAKIREIVRIPKDTSGLDARLLKVWGQAMEKGIEEAWRTERYFEVRDCCRKLLAYSPGNAVAEDYMAKFEAWQQKQRRFVPVRKREEAADGDKKKEVE